MNKILLITFILLIGCNQVPKKLEGNRLMALDKFWKTLGGDVETKQDN
jgi:starvation-inducible outer membrane lipoprotein